jgi:hypothetical protein
MKSNPRIGRRMPINREVSTRKPIVLKIMPAKRIETLSLIKKLKFKAFNLAEAFSRLKSEKAFKPKGLIMDISE